MGSEVWCGKSYAMPFDADPRAVYYNKTLLKQAGRQGPVGRPQGGSGPSPTWKR